MSNVEVTEEQLGSELLNEKYKYWDRYSDDPSPELTDDERAMITVFCRHLAALKKELGGR